VRPGHFLKFGKVPGSNSCIEKKFMLGTRKYEEYKGVRFGNGDCALVVDVWLHRVDEDASGLTFEVRLELQLEAAARGARRTRGAALKQIHGMGTRRYVLSVDNDNEFRSRCE
jgi:hypothetical protein